MTANSMPRMEPGQTECPACHQPGWPDPNKPGSYRHPGRRWACAAPVVDWITDRVLDDVVAASTPGQVRLADLQRHARRIAPTFNA